MKKRRAHPRPKGNAPTPEPRRPRLPPPPRPKPQYYRLTVWGREDLPGIVLIERGPLGFCENRGGMIANYGMFFEMLDGRRVWGKPLRVEIEPVKEESDARHQRIPGAPDA